MTQLVVSGNRILAHGEDCFLAMGGTVICTATERKFENATVVFHDGGIPSDIDSVGYEYHAGEFVPCAPYGKGTGNIAVVCDECGTIKNSGISTANLCKILKLNYEGKGGTAELEINGIYPLFAEICQITTSEGYGDKYSGVVTRHGGYAVNSYASTFGGSPETNIAGLQSWFDAEKNTLCWRNPHGDADLGLNASGATYLVTVIGTEVV